MDRVLQVGPNIQPEDDIPVEESNIPLPPPCRSDTHRHAHEFYGLHITEGNDILLGVNESISYHGAMDDPKVAKWKETTERERFNPCIIIKFGTWLIQHLTLKPLFVGGSSRRNQHG